MDIRIEPAKLAGSIAAIPSKSYAQRVLLASSLADGRTEILLNSVSDDIRSAINALTALGADIKIRRESLIVSPVKPVAYPTINCGESGTIARFLLPVAAALYENGVISGEGSLVKRPFATLCDVLEKNGCSCLSKELPITFHGRIRPGHYEIRGDESSQYLSGLLFALPLLGGDSKVTLTTGLESSGYADMTLAVLKTFGVASGYEVGGGEGRYYIGAAEIKGRQIYRSPGRVVVEGDWSNAAFWLAAGVEVTGLRTDSPQQDRQFLAIKDENEIDAAEIPDLAPILSVMAAAKSGVARIYNVKRLRLKESDRMESIANMLAALGCHTETSDNEIIIFGTGKMRGGTVDGAGDHRIVMSAAIASCFCEEAVTIRGAQAVNKSYPHFFADFNMLGGKSFVI